ECPEQDGDVVAGAGPVEQRVKIRHCECHAARGRRPIGAGDVEKHGTSPPGHARTGIVVDLDDYVVEVIVAPKAVAWLIGRAPERPVVTSIFGIFTPRSMWIDPPYP